MADKIRTSPAILRHVARWHMDAAEETKPWERARKDRHLRIAESLRKQADALAKVEEIGRVA